MKIAQMSLDDRPREKMERFGARSLSSAELLAVILRAGTREYNAVDLSRIILAGAGGSLVRLSCSSPQELCVSKGMGKGKALSVLAALELGRRMMGEKPSPEGQLIVSAEDVYDLMHPFLKGLDHEECWAIYLGRSARLKGEELLSTGNDISTTLDAADVARRAVTHKVRRMVLVHNHPSGDPSPSSQDLRLTGEVKKALGLFRIGLVDHLILSDGAFYSFSRGVMSVR